MFHINDKVCSRRIGLPMTGTIKMLIDARTHLCFERQNDVVRWNVYEDWREKPVAMVKFDKPQRELTIDEFEEINEGIAPDLLQEAYEQLPLEVYGYYPIDDLQIMGLAEKD